MKWVTTSYQTKVKTVGNDLWHHQERTSSTSRLSLGLVWLALLSKDLRYFFWQNFHLTICIFTFHFQAKTIDCTTPRFSRNWWETKQHFCSKLKWFKTKTSSVWKSCITCHHSNFEQSSLDSSKVILHQNWLYMKLLWFLLGPSRSRKVDNKSETKLLASVRFGVSHTSNSSSALLRFLAKIKFVASFLLAHLLVMLVSSWPCMYYH